MLVMFLIEFIIPNIKKKCKTCFLCEGSLECTKKISFVYFCVTVRFDSRNTNVIQQKQEINVVKIMAKLV